MKLFLLLFGVTAALAAPSVQNENIVTDYHTQIGIPKAARIKAAEAASDFDGARIVGGSLSTLGQFPYFGGLLVTLTTEAQSVCGSSLITTNRVVTAAHCWRTIVTQATLMTVVLGSLRLFTGGVRINSNDIVIHENYDMINLRNNIAILRISSVTSTNTIAPIPLASGSNLYVGSSATVCGFGRTSDWMGSLSEELRHVDLVVISNEECINIYGSSPVTDSTLCTTGDNGRSTCGGDTGGPLVINNQLVGITSFTASTGCEFGLPVGFTRVTSFNAWVLARI